MNEFYNELKTDKNSMDIFEDGLKCPLKKGKWLLRLERKLIS